MRVHSYVSDERRTAAFAAATSTECESRPRSVAVVEALVLGEAMNRRESMKALGLLAASTGMTVTPITAQDASEAVMLVLKVGGHLSQETHQRISEGMRVACEGTALEGVRVVVLTEGMTLDVIKESDSRIDSLERRLEPEALAEAIAKAIQRNSYGLMSKVRE